MKKIEKSKIMEQMIGNKYEKKMKSDQIVYSEKNKSTKKIRRRGHQKILRDREELTQTRASIIHHVFDFFKIAVGSASPVLRVVLKKDRAVESTKRLIRVSPRAL